MFVRLLIFAAITLFAWPGPADAASWEVLYSAESDNIDEKIELKNRSLRQRIVRGEKIVTAHIRMFYRQDTQNSRATGDYEIHCAARTAYRSNLKKIESESGRTTESTFASTKEMLSGKEYQDFINLMDILCSR